MISENENDMTVDLLSIDDFKKFVLEDETKEVVKNSKYLEDKDKVLSARKFLDKVNRNEVTLSKESIDKIDTFFNKVKF